jgi:hypothetical protein
MVEAVSARMQHCLLCPGSEFESAGWALDQDQRDHCQQTRDKCEEDAARIPRTTIALTATEPRS